MKKVLHLLSGGGAGGIEILCEQIGLRGQYRHEFCFLFSGGVIADRMKEEGLTTYDLSGESFWNKRRKLLDIFAEGEYSAVVVHHEGVKLYMLYEALIRFAEKGKMLDVTFIKYLHCTFDDSDFYTGKKVEDWLHHYLLGKTLADSDRLVAVSEFAGMSYADEFGLDDDRIQVIYNGIDVSDGESAVTDGKMTRRIEQEQCTGKEEVQSLDGSRLLYIGRLVKVKGVDVLIKAVALLKKQGNVVTLDILGDGEARKDFEKLSSDLGVSEQIFFHGVILDKKEYFQRDGIFVYPSVWQEAFGISIIEAMSNGLICVASEVGGIPEIITEKEQGILFEAGNAEALATAIVEAQRRGDAGNYQAYRDEILSRAAEFDIQKSVEQLEELV
ncbi:glycosyltransferase family 4 protein [Butyrivibrio proteoclasticus]|uniref:glycosyltransferase family 4 protein n=1 Tax=Butyrivibrio proteoclasticus TaxID=43305 RepID=UPI00047E9781|nr:glycosyltransferase family 4 protein [Butyrivibrio proteoclasticus]